FIIANRLGELDDIRYQYKHLWQNMTLVYAQRGFESIGELLNIADEFSEHITSLTVNEIVEASLDGNIAGHGGARFSSRIKEMLGNQVEENVQPHFKDINQLVEFISKSSNDLRG
ncbi:integrase, partial [Vibrio anguillarum]|nr:integrase [Vibrio anguillarum]